MALIKIRPQRIKATEEIRSWTGRRPQQQDHLADQRYVIQWDEKDKKIDRHGIPSLLAYPARGRYAPGYTGSRFSTWPIYWVTAILIYKRHAQPPWIAVCLLRTSSYLKVVSSCSKRVVWRARFSCLEYVPLSVCRVTSLW